MHELRSEDFESPCQPWLLPLLTPRLPTAETNPECAHPVRGDSLERSVTSLVAAQ